MKLATSRQPATNHMPEAEDWVRFLSAPITMVAPIPPSVDMEAMIAMPAAAARPLRKVPGMHQNEGRAAINPIFARENNTTVTMGLLLNRGLRPTLIAASSVGSAVCQRRSRTRSELRQLMISAAIDKMLVTPVSTPI